jgi:hypothetical protein
MGRQQKRRQEQHELTALRKQREQQQAFVKPELADKDMQGPPGDFARAITGGTEPAADLYMLLIQIMVALVGDQIVVTDPDGNPLDLGTSELPTLIFLHPQGPKTMTVVKRLEERGYLRLVSGSEHGAEYALVMSDDRKAWAEGITGELNKVHDEIVRAGLAAEMESSLSALGITGERWKSSLMFISDKIMATFTKEQQEEHDCASCRAAVGRWNGVVKMPTPKCLKGVVDNFMMEIMVCPDCYNNLPLPELMSRVWWSAKQWAASQYGVAA